MQTKRKQRIIQCLSDQLNPDKIDVEDQSESHRGHSGWQEGGETHFHITIAAKKLDGLSRVQQHRLINQCLKSEYSSGLHALSITILP